MSLMSRKDVPHLRLITQDQIKHHPAPAPQGDLFPKIKANTLVFAYAPAIGDTFTSLLHAFRPVWLFDIRPAPRFDTLGGRRNIFMYFDRLRIQYRDIAGMLEAGTYKTVTMNGAFLADAIASAQQPCDNSNGPIVFLLDDLDYFRHVVQLLPNCLQPPTRRRWEIVQIKQPYQQ